MVTPATGTHWDIHLSISLVPSVAEDPSWGLEVWNCQVEKPEKDKYIYIPDDSL
jgi:hypothetical protein